MDNKTPTIQEAAINSLFDYATPAEIAEHLEDAALAYINQMDALGNAVVSKEQVNATLILTARLTALVYSLAPK